MTRREAAHHLQVSYAAIRRLEVAGELRAWAGRGAQQIVYDPEDVMRVRAVARARLPDRSAEGELAARAYALFREGRTVSEVVIELRCPPRLVRELYADHALPDDLIVPGEVLTRIHALGFGRVTPDHVVHAFEALLEVQRRHLAEMLTGE